MLGKIFIINKNSNTGKVLFEDGKESNIIDFPITFENDDKIEISFRNNNIEDKPLSMVAYSEKNYGFVMKKFNPNNGNILVTYPKIIGLIYFNNSNITDKDNPKIVFDVKKSIDGKLEAINIKNTNKSDFYKCEVPIFGKIKKTITEVKESYISNIIEKTQMENIVSGKVKAIKEDRGFGFIECFDNSQDVYFNLKAFIKFYNKSPKKDDIVNCKIHTSERGSSVVSFCDSEQYLPKEEQYGIIDNKKFFIKDYEKKFNKKPQIGDIIYYTIENKKINFKETAETIEMLEFQQFSEKNTKYNQGKVAFLKNSDNGIFGFIKSSDKSIYFNADSFKKTYNREPKKDDLAFFEEIETSKGFSVKSFIKPDNKILALSSTYKNFVYPDENSLYYAYIDNNETKEIHKYNSKILTESISCYKDKNIPKLFKLQAINTLIENNYNDKKISISMLKKERLGLLNTLVDENIKLKNSFEAIKYEYLLQNISYNPNRLSRLSKVLNKEYNIEFMNNVDFKETKFSEKVNFDLEIKDIKFEENDYREVLFIDLNNYKIEPIPSYEEKWNIE